MSDSDHESSVSPMSRVTHGHRGSDLTKQKTPRVRVHSEKQRSNDIDHAESKVKALEKQLKAARKAAKKAKDANKNTRRHVSDDGDQSLESEEEDEVGYQPPSLFTSSMKSLGTINGSPSRPYKPRLHKEGDRPALSPITNGTPCHIGDLFRDPLTEENDTPSRGRSVSRTPARTGSSRSHTSSRPPSPSFRKRTASRSLSAAPPHKQSKTVVPQWLNGQAPTGRPKAHDYEHDVCGLIIKACHDFESRVCSLDAKPDLDKQILWAKDAWKKVCDTVDIDYELTDRILGLIKSRTSHARATIKDTVRPKIPSTYGFVATDNPNGKVARRNKRLHDELLDEDAFHYKDTKERTGFAQHKLISEAIQGAWFANKTAPGVIFSSNFKPISFVTLALVLATIEFLIGEWSTGVFVKGVFNEKTIQDSYETHLKALQDWGADSPEIIKKIRTKLFDRALRNAGATPFEAKPRMTEEAKARAKKELEGHTGDTDSEAEDGEELDDA